MNSNIKILFVAGLTFGFVNGLFELVFPLFLTHIGISLVDIGIIFSIAALVMASFRMFLGEYTDIYGRKIVYSISFAVGALSKALFPFSFEMISLTFNKILTDISANIRASIHSVMLYENDSENYARWYSFLQGSQMLLMAIGDFAVSVLIFTIDYAGCFYLLALVQVITFLFFLKFYREKYQLRKDRKISLKKTFSFDIHRNLKVLAITSTLLTVGIQINHTFTLPLYFVGKYNLDAGQIGIVMGIHRLGFITTFLSNKYLKIFSLKKAYIYSGLAYALSFLIVGIFSLPILIFVPIWLIHELLGGGIWVTTREVIVQKFSREGRRGKDLNTFTLIQSLSTIFIPSLAGTLAAMDWNNIFLVGGILCSIGILLFFLLYKEE